ncbi:hypothetical protein TNIN_89451 [Trichonephila inaurata madagascariensis]|uniref:Uncharacterized protein n=1 Tax=Trichonephila inaurata madagascariensis TaxID=2747483 RepID=A0A8X7BPJ8_9ARAC|nr:hypothetical protein TNIN_127001 [Trichonephila inaurata madagascariensis]GFY56111.1 hypothetical protein TNIN_89451 [Trichonephila inaurata madagascariensis]
MVALGRTGLADLQTSFLPLSSGLGVKRRVLKVTFPPSLETSDTPEVILSPSNHQVVRARGREPLVSHVNSCSSPASRIRGSPKILVSRGKTMEKKMLKYFMVLKRET